MSIHSLEETARNNAAAVLQGLARTGLRPVASALQVDKSTISRMKQGEIERHAKLLAACGLKVVPLSMEVIRPEDFKALLHFARQRINGVTSVADLNNSGDF